MANFVANVKYDASERFAVLSEEQQRDIGDIIGTVDDLAPIVHRLGLQEKFDLIRSSESPGYRALSMWSEKTCSTFNVLWMIFRSLERCDLITKLEQYIKKPENSCISGKLKQLGLNTFGSNCNLANVSKEQAIEMLKRCGKRGCYVIRRKTNSDSLYVLSTLYENKVWHFDIFEDDDEGDSKYYIFKDGYSSRTITNLITHYTNNPFKSEIDKVPEFFLSEPI